MIDCSVAPHNVEVVFLMSESVAGTSPPFDLTIRSIRVENAVFELDNNGQELDLFFKTDPPGTDFTAAIELNNGKLNTNFRQLNSTTEIDLAIRSLGGKSVVRGLSNNPNSKTLEISVVPGAELSILSSLTTNITSLLRGCLDGGRMIVTGDQTKFELQLTADTDPGNPYVFAKQRLSIQNEITRRAYLENKPDIPDILSNLKLCKGK
jgi:hypothetical protein